MIFKKNSNRIQHCSVTSMKLGDVTKLCVNCVLRNKSLKRGTMHQTRKYSNGVFWFYFLNVQLHPKWIGVNPFLVLVFIFLFYVHIWRFLSNKLNLSHGLNTCKFLCNDSCRAEIRARERKTECSYLNPKPHNLASASSFLDAVWFRNDFAVYRKANMFLFCHFRTSAVGMCR